MAPSSGYDTPENYKERYLGLIGVDDTVTPPIPMVGILNWTGSGWEKNTGSSVPLTLVYTSGDLTSIQKVVGGTTYTKTLTYTSGELTGVSAWV